MNIKYELESKALSKICHIKTGKLDANAAEETGKYPFFTCSREIFQINSWAFDCNAVLLAGNNASGDFNVKIYDGKFNAYQRTYVIYLKDEFQNVIDLRIIYYSVEKFLKDLKQMSQGSNTKFIKLPWVKNIPVVYPKDKKQLSSFIQWIEKNAELAKSLKNIADRQKEAIQALQGAFLRESFPWKVGVDLPMGWEWKKISTFLEVEKIQIERDNAEYSKLPFVGLENIKSHTREYTVEDGLNEPIGMCFKFSKQHILYGKLRPYLNKVFIPESEGKCSMELLPLKPKNSYSRDFIAAIMQSSQVLEVADLFSTGGRMPRADMKKIMEYKIAVPTDVNECNNLGKKISLSITKQLKLQQEAIKQIEAIEALPSAILRKVFNFEETQSEDDLMMAAEPEIKYKMN